MIDWMNPTAEMLAGRDAGRKDREDEVEDLQAEVVAMGEELEQLRAIVGPLEELLVADGTVVITRYSAPEMRSTSDCVTVTGDLGVFEGPTLAEALDAANAARKASES